MQCKALDTCIITYADHIVHAGKIDKHKYFANLFHGNCSKKGNSYGVQIVDTEKSYYDVVAEVPAGENDGKCKCGPSCSCVNCTCGSH
ncbi:hypothetical protein AQUCO_00800273v1 [Aquilegia coerulea]|uniref:Uncharacterized protein n=1 Tax=Aquilegia coerulea TaxID=218851 RepID=A0A2G5EII2_AQUCA|nr:hypothetical protein AQUCO_00800273v1 [Aquilegia coerulea]